MKIFVVNLKDSLERRETMRAKLSSLDLEFEFFEAVDGRHEPDPLFNKLDEEKRIWYRGRKLSGGELGCYGSHYKLWERCSELDEPIVVIEDDVGIHDHFPAALKEAEKLIDQALYIRMASTKRKPYEKLKKSGKYELVRYMQGPAGTLCYVLHPYAARAFLAHSQTWYMAVDDFMDRYWHHHIQCFALFPQPIYVEEGESDIVRIKNQKKSLSARAKHEWMRLVEQIKRTVYFYTHRPNIH